MRGRVRPVDRGIYAGLVVGSIVLVPTGGETQQLTVSATVGGGGGSVTVTSPDDEADMGDLTTGSDGTATATFSVSCASCENIVVAVGGGENASGGQRYIRHTSPGVDDLIPYALSSVNNGGSPYAVDGSQTVPVDGAGEVDVVIESFIDSDDFAGKTPGTYQDTVIVTFEAA